MDLNDGKKVWSGLKSKLGLKPKGEADPGYDEAYYGEGYDDAYGDYDEYAAYGDGYDPAYEEGYDDAYGAYDQGYDAYGSDSRGSSRSRGSSLPRLVSMSDARASARSGLGYQGSSSPRTSSSRGFSTGRAVYDASLPYEMTPEGSAAVSARGTRRYEEGFVSPYEAVDAARPVSAGYADEALSRASGSFGASGDIQSRTSASLAALRERIASSGTPPKASTTAEPAPSGPRKLTVVKPIRYGEADRIPAALKKGDAVVLVLKGVSGGLDKRILDFSFGAASALDAEVECVADKVFFIGTGDGLSDGERASLQAQGLL